VYAGAKDNGTGTGYRDTAELLFYPATWHNPCKHKTHLLSTPPSIISSNQRAAQPASTNRNPSPTPRGAARALPWPPRDQHFCWSVWNLGLRGTSPIVFLSSTIECNTMQLFNSTAAQRWRIWCRVYIYVSMRSRGTPRLRARLPHARARHVLDDLFLVFCPVMRVPDWCHNGPVYGGFIRSYYC